MTEIFATSIGTPALWGAFAAAVLAMLAVDLFLVGGGKEHRVSFKEAAGWSAAWVAVAAGFAGWLYWSLSGTLGPEAAQTKTMEFATGYLLEKALAVDNVFVWMMIFSAFAVPPELQRRVLLYGIIGAIVLRTGIILAGSALIAQFHWVLYLFGAFLLFTGIKMWSESDGDEDARDSRLLSFLKARLRVSDQLEGEKFLTKKDGILFATPLLLCLVMVELSDVVFAVDSIPAVFAVTTDPFIVLTSNLFAILGLRAMYFLLGGMADKFSLLKYGLSAVLVFIGVKMMLIDLYKIPIGFSLAVVAAFIGGSIYLSIRRERKLAEAARASEK